MYYKSILIMKKDKDSEYSRIEILEETINEGYCLVKAHLKPKDIQICPRCSSTNIISNGKKQRTIQDEYYANVVTFIDLHYHRFKCKNCGKLFVDSIPGIGDKETIPMNIKFNILEDLKDDVSFTYIANKRNVSIQTVIDIFEGYVHFNRVPFGDVLCMDEFKNLKHTKGKYAFVMYDPNAHKINDILEDRIQATIDDYLYTIDWKEKDKVKYVVTDMSESYRTIIKKHFINATHIVDTFHFLRYVEDAFNNVRIRVQQLYKDTTPEYKILKRYWRILSTYAIDIDGDSLYNPLTRRSASITDIIQDAVNLNPDLQSAYSLTQHFLHGCKTTKYEDSREWLDGWLKDVKEADVKEFTELEGMFSNWKEEILHSFIRFGDRRLHNGYLEGMNNQIKVIKRVAFGYRNFTHFRNRIMYIVNAGIYAYRKIDRSKIFRKKKRNYKK